MPSRPDIRDLATNVRDAFADADRETLIDVLTFVVKEYVVEGPPPMLMHQAENLADLQNMTFAQLVAALQTRLDHPELAMFVIDGDQVGVRIGGVLHPLRPGIAPPANFIDTRPNAAPPGIPGSPGSPGQAPGVRVVEANLAPRPPAPAQVPAPPPSRGLSIRGQPSGAAGVPATPPPAPAPAQVAQPAPSPAGGAQPAASPQTDKPEGSGDDASARFSLLELD